MVSSAFYLTVDGGKITFGIYIYDILRLKFEDFPETYSYNFDLMTLDQESYYRDGAWPRKRKTAISPPEKNTRRT